MKTRILFVAFSLTCLGCISGQSRKLPLNFTSTLSQNAVLRFKIENIGSSPIQFQPNSLPWQSHSSLSISIVNDVESLSELEQNYRVGDIPIGTIGTYLAPHSTISGDLNLSVKFGDLEEAVRENGVIVVWIYKPTLVGFEDLPSFVGFGAINSHSESVPKGVK